MTKRADTWQAYSRGGPSHDLGPSGGYGAGSGYGYAGHVNFSDQEKSRSNSKGRRGTLPSSMSPGGMNSPGKAGGILKRKPIEEDSGYLKSIKEDQRSEFMNADDSRGYSMTQHGDDVTKIDRSNSRISDSRLEESIRDPQRPPKQIPGLVQFLIEEHKNRLGIFTQDDKKLFRFWKQHVSTYYRQERELQNDQRNRSTGGFNGVGDLYLDEQQTPSGLRVSMKAGDSGLGPYAMSSFTKMERQKQRKLFTQGPRASSALRFSDKKQHASSKDLRPIKGGILEKYDLYGNCYEIDIIYTIKNEIALMNDKYKSQKLMLHNQKEQLRYDSELEAWKGKIARALLEYYNYKKELVLMQHVEEREKAEKMKQKQIKKDGLKKRADSKAATLPKKADGEKPAATMLAPQDLKSQFKVQDKAATMKKQTIFDLMKPKCDPKFFEQTTQEFLRKEEDMRAVLFTVLVAKFEENFVREEMVDETAAEKKTESQIEEEKAKKKKPGLLMANTLREVSSVFEKRRALAPSKLHNGNVTMLLSQFFDPYEVVLRLNIYKDRINTSKRRAQGVPLHAFYLNVSQNERLAYLFDIDEPEKKKLKPQYGQKDKEENLSEAQKAINKFIAVKEAEFAKRAEEARKKEERKKAKQEQQIYSSVFGDQFKKVVNDKPEIEFKHRPDYKQPKDKWKLGRQLKELAKEFPHDRVLQRMIEEEFKTNQTFKYPEEYDIYDGAKEGSLKKNFGSEVVQPGSGEFAWKRPDFSRETEIIQEFKQKDNYRKREARENQKAEAMSMQALEDWLAAKAMLYHDYMEGRGKLKEGLPKKTLRRLLAENYQAMINGENGEVAKKRFPHISYGQDVNSNTFKQSYPQSFKRYFFSLVKAIIIKKKGKGKTFQKKPVTLTMLAPSRVPSLQDPISMKSYNTKLQSFQIGQQAKAMGRIDPNAWRSRVFRRQDQLNRLKNVFMTFEEIQNCTFEPEAGCLNRNWKKATRIINDERLKKEAVPGEFFDRLGDNFCKAEPAIYKRGKLKKAKLLWRQGDPDKAFATLCEGFNLGQLYQYHEPAKYKNWKDYKSHLERIEQEQRTKERAERAKQNQKGKQGAEESPEKKKSSLLKRSTDDLNPQQVQEVQDVFNKFQTNPEPVSGKPKQPPYLKISDMKGAIQQLGQNPRDFEIIDIEKKIRMQQAEDLKKQDIDQVEKAKLMKAPIHITYDMFLNIMSVRLKVALSDNDLKAAFKLLDKDKSGSLDADEFRNVLQNLGTSFTEDEIEEMIRQADTDGSGSIEQDEFVAVMRLKASTMSNDPDLKFVGALQQEIKMYLQLNEVKQAYRKMGAGLVRILDKAFERNDEELKHHPEKKGILNEDVSKPTLRAVYDECYDMLSQIIKREEEIERRKHGLKKRQNQLERAKENLKKQVAEGFEENNDDDDEQDFRKLFKTIMCPMKDACPKLIPPRWPSSKHKSITRFGKNCPYAHHPMELQFPQTLDMRIAANKACAKKDPYAAPSKRFVNSSELYECTGCGGRCNMCAYKQLAQQTNDAMAAKLAKKSFANQDKDKINDRKKQNDQIREDFAKKFGILKKASVLLFYGRANDAFEEIAKAAKIIQREADTKKSQEEELQREWQKKLGLSDFEMPKPIDKIKPEDVTEDFLKQIEAGTTDLATLKIYIQQVCPLVRDQNDRNTFLNGLVEELYLKCEEIMIEKKNTIDGIKTKVEQLGQVAELMDQLGSDADKADAEELAAEFDEDNPIKIKKQKKSMCEFVQKKKYWKEDGIDLKTTKGKEKYWVDNKYQRKTVMDPKTGIEGCIVCPLGKKCQHAHNAIELDWTPLEDKIKNLNGVIKAQTHQLKNDRPREAWRPSAKNFQPSDLPDHSRKKKAGEEEEDKKRPARKGILDREDVFKKPYSKE